MQSFQTPIKGRGTTHNQHNRLASKQVAPVDDGWFMEEEGEPHPNTLVLAEKAKSIIATNRSPDIPFEQSINPYRGCEHGCIYCFARPCHAYVDLSPGLDFETRLFYKENAAELLKKAFDKPEYQCKTISLGTNTDPYQPIEKELRITRSLLETMQTYNHPFSIVTKSALVVRDLDILGPMAARNLCRVFISVTTLDNSLKRIMEPRTSSASARLRAIEKLNQAGVPTGIMAAPMIPAINDSELERILKAGREAGATQAGNIFIRLPHEVRPLFHEWLETHFPERAEHVKDLVRQSRGGKDYDSAWGKRMSGTGVFAEAIAQRFAIQCRKLGLNAKPWPSLATRLFKVPERTGAQMMLF